IAVTLSYEDKKGNIHEVLPLFREPGQEDVLKRYLDFDLTQAGFSDFLSKPYDGLPFPSFRLDQSPVTTPEPDNKVLDKVADSSGRTLIDYSYQPYSHAPGKGDGEPRPLGPATSDTAKDESGNEVTLLPSDAGVTKFTLVSRQYADENSADEEIREFAKSYWGHRATGWCEITPVASRVAGVTAKWADGSDVADAQLPGKVLDVEVDVTSGDGTAATCKAPTGKVQLYVDGEPAGDPVEIRFAAGTAADGSPLPANAAVRADADGREHTVVSWSFPAGELMSPGARHKISARYIPAINYLESADPAKADVPESEVAVRPDPKIAPEPAVSKAVENLTHPQGPTQPGDRLRYTVTGSNSAEGSLWTDVVLTDALPKCLELDASTLHLENAWEGIDGA
ncbi:hypothetical protein, partial [uncultured Adlercreutzia sp.]|uniref:hypothetical protein n=1 Tax=uncultured Adlercreutzia sp. TaxID=875803 RepID=UPI0026F3DFFC